MAEPSTSTPVTTTGIGRLFITPDGIRLPFESIGYYQLTDGTLTINLNSGTTLTYAMTNNAMIQALDQFMVSGAPVWDLSVGPFVTDMTNAWNDGGGTSVTVTGFNFTASTQLFLNGSAQSITPSSGTSMSFTAPAEFGANPSRITVFDNPDYPMSVNLVYGWT